MSDGIPNLGIPPLDPLVIDDFYLAEDSHLVKCRVDFESVVVTGLSGIKILSVDYEESGLKVTIYASVKELKAIGSYNLDGKALVFIPLEGDGDAIVEAEEASVVISISVPSRDDLNPNIEVSFDVGSLKVYFEDLLGGEGLGDVLNQVLNIFGKKIFEIAESSISKEVKYALEKLINEEMSKM